VGKLKGETFELFCSFFNSEVPKGANAVEISQGTFSDRGAIPLASTAKYQQINDF